jgi:molybdopterin converting factor small subunit
MSDSAVVDIHLFAAARAAVGESAVTARPGTLASILDELSDRYPAFARVRPQCSYLLDEVSCSDPQTLIAAGSRLDVLPPFAGG